MNVAAAPDLLRRFVYTPYTISVCLCGKTFSLRSNDTDIIDCLRGESESSSSDPSPDWACILVRDHESPFCAPINIFFGHDELEIDTYVGGTQIVVDYQTKEVFGFIAANEPGGHVVELLIRVLARFSGSKSG